MDVVTVFHHRCGRFEGSLFVMNVEPDHDVVAREKTTDNIHNALSPCSYVGKALDNTPPQTPYSQRRPGGDLVLRRTRIAVMPNSAAKKAVMRSIQNNIEWEVQHKVRS